MNRKFIARSLAIALLGSTAAGFPTDGAHAAVGRIEAAHGVTPSGAVSYSIPIRVTDGIAGLTPRLAISYVGPGTRTVLGVGSALSGISFITPCRKTIAQDLNAGPVTLTSADRFCLDGARLRLVSGTYGAAGAVYRTELDQIMRVTSVTSTNGIPDKFKVEMPNGLQYEYGYTADSKLLASATAGAPPQFWAVNKISDAVGNSISFVYDTDNALRRFRPNYILYTERNGVGAHYKVSFVYQGSSQPEPTLEFTPSAAGGAAQSDDKLLDRIELLHDSIVYRKVKFTYESGAGTNQRLKTVQECVPGAPDDCLPATTLGWQSASSGHGSAVSSYAVASGVIPLDINNDGFEDLAWAASGTWKYMLGSASGYGSVVSSGVIATNPSKAMPLEWNADGFWDLLIDWSDGKWRVLTGSASGLSTSPVHAGPGAGIPSNAANTSWTVADADNDGRDDLFSMQLSTGLGIYIRLNSATGFGASTAALLDTEAMHTLSQGFIKRNGASTITRPDFNGDGRTDLLIYGCYWDIEPPAHCIFTAWFQLVSNGSTYVNVGPLPSAAYNIDVRYGDFNADGLTDVVYPASTGVWKLGFGQGSGSFSVVNGPSTTSYATYQTLTGDYDGDGFDDFYVTRNSPWQWEVFRSTVSGLASGATVTGISGNGLGWMLTDQNGDGLSDLGRYDSASLVWSTFAHQGLPGERLASSTDGLGNTVTFSYLPMSNGAVYTRGVGAIYPIRDFQSSMPLVNAMQVSPAGGIPFTLTFKYSAGRVDVRGRSFLGMESRTIADSRNSIFATESYRQDFPYIGAPVEVTIKQSSVGGAPTIQSVTHTYNRHTITSAPGNESYLPYRSGSVTKIHEVGGVKNGNLITEITEGATVNTFGNTTFGWTYVDDEDIGSPEFGQTWRTEVTAAYSQDQTNWCMAVPTSRSEKRILPDLSNVTRATSWVVSGLECRVTQETIEPGAGSTLSLVTDLDYDGCGNVDLISTYPAGQPSLARATQINYGSRCQRPESITNPENHASTIAYNWPLALPSSQTDPNGLVVNLEYDGFGRLTRQRRPDLTASRFALTACTAGNSWCGKTSSARVKVTRTERNTIDGILRTDEQFLDGFGRARWSHSDSLESGPAIVETLYDAFGRTSQQTQPYFTGGGVYVTTYFRDLVGRVTQVNAPIDEASPSGRITGYAYEGRDLKITDPRNFTTTRHSNAIGQLLAVIDPSPGGTTDYAYQPFGEIASITDAANNVTSWTYNLRGFVTGITDPDSGSWTYESNAFGEQEKIRDAKTAPPNYSTQFTYDKLSRPLTRVEAEGTTNFTYGTSAAAKNIGRLASILSPGSYIEAFTFDSLGRLGQQAVTADGATYNINLTYHAQTGLLDTLQYPTSTSGYRLKLAYEYSNNLLQKVRDFNGSTIFWQATSTDAYGHIQNESFGNGVLTYTDFDQASGLMAAREGGVGGGIGLINSQVAWDLNGNLTQRKDLKLSPTITEDFVYDSLNRFDLSQRTAGAGGPATNQDVTLDPIGNISWKMGIGNYTYHATKKRAVISAGSFSFGYDANGNVTSRNGSTIGYTSYNLPNLINSGISSSAISYGAFRNRYKQIAVNAGATETTIYVGGLLEKVTRGSLVEWRHLIHGINGAAAIHTRRTGGTPASDTIYVHRDHLGSPELITNSSGGVVVRLSFGAYGERRDGSDWDGPVSSADLTTIGNTSRRGFTGHEHLDAVGLIHMNGRVYEPVAGRFLGVDPILSLGLSQDVNSYSYAWNNPLNVTDPSGLGERDGPIIISCLDYCDWFPPDTYEPPPDVGPYGGTENYSLSKFDGRSSFIGRQVIISGLGASSAAANFAADPQRGPAVEKTIGELRQEQARALACFRGADSAANSIATMSSFTVAGAQYGRLHGALLGLLVGGAVASADSFFSTDDDLTQISAEGMGAVILDGGNPTGFYGAVISGLIRDAFTEYPGIGEIGGATAGSLVVHLLRRQTFRGATRAGRYGAAAGAVYLGIYMPIFKITFGNCMGT